MDINEIEGVPKRFKWELLVIAFAGLYFFTHLVLWATTEKFIIENDVPVVIEAETTAYSEIDSCHTGKSCLMANGKRAHIGAVACPRNIKLGTWIEIAGQVYECADRTAKWVDGRFDIFVGWGKGAHREALAYGVQILEVKILK